MKILITGGTGFIGSHLIPRLLRDGHNIVLLKRSSSDTWRIKNLLKKLRLYNIDKFKNFDEIFMQNKFDLIIHLSGMYVKYHKNIKEIEQMNQININFPAKLLDTAVRYNVRGFINTGTFFEYKQTHKKISENSSIEPFNYYTATKLAFEQILKYYASLGKIRAVTLKLFSPYGEKDNKKLIRVLIESFIKEIPLSLTKGEQRLSFTYVEDIVEAYLKTAKYINSSRFLKYESFNIGSDRSYTVKQIVNIIRKISGKRSQIKLGAVSYQNRELMLARCDNSKSKKILNWYAKTDIISGFTKTYRYYLKHSI